MIDAHCHLMHEKFNADRHEVIERAKMAGLRVVIENGGNLEQNTRTLGLVQQNKGFTYAAIGLAPHYVQQADLAKEFEFIQRNADSAVAIGEIGLEYHYFKEEKEREKQKSIFRQQLILAERLQLPVVIHCREAWPDLLLILKEFQHVKVMLHFFNKPKYLTEALKRGYVLSISTLKSKDLDKIIKAAPLNNLVCETDSPYLWDGGRNEPANVRFAYERIAEKKEMPLEEVMNAVRANVSKFFGIVF